MSFLLPAGDKVISFFQALLESRDLCRVILKIGIHRDDDVSLGLFETDREGRGFPVVAAETDDLYVPIMALDVAQELERAIVAPVVDKEQLVANIHSPDGRSKLLMKFPEGFFFVVEWYDNRKIHPAGRNTSRLMVRTFFLR